MVRLYDEVDVQQVDEFLLVPILTFIIIIGAIMTSAIVFRILLCDAHRKRRKEKTKKDMEVRTQAGWYF